LIRKYPAPLTACVKGANCRKIGILRRHEKNSERQKAGIYHPTG
jgi:hypothetical protein